MMQREIERRNLDNQVFFKLRHATEKISQWLTKRLKSHLEVIKPLFIPRMLLGNYVKSAFMEEVPGTEKAFAELQEWYARICEKPFGLPKKLQPPLPAIPNQLEVTSFQYPLQLVGTEGNPVTITSPTQWVLSYQSDCPFNRLKAIASGKEPGQPDEMRQSIINHTTMVLFLRRFSALNQLLQDLRYQVEIREIDDLGHLPVVILKSQVETFLPPDDFILQITQLSGIPAFHEIIGPEAVDEVSDPLKEALRDLIG
jgi:hypothetical protein